MGVTYLGRSQAVVWIIEEEKTMLKCSVVMTKDPVCCVPNDPVSEAARIMKEENVGSVPVVESKETNRLVGIVTDRDLALQVVANRCDSKSTRVADVMTSEVVTCRPDDDLQKALDLMAQHQLRRIPVVDDNSQVVGIISQADIATRIDEPGETAETVKAISQPPIDTDESDTTLHEMPPERG